MKCFTLHVMNLEYMNVSLLEISYNKKNIFFKIFNFFLDAPVFKNRVKPQQENTLIITMNHRKQNHHLH